MGRTSMSEETRAPGPLFERRGGTDGTGIGGSNNVARGARYTDSLRTTPTESDVPNWATELVPLDRPLVVIDLEATGTAPHRDRIVEIGLLKIFPDGRKLARHRRVNPCMPIPQEASEVHGIYDQDVANEPEFRMVATALAELLLDSDLAGFGIVQFDLPLLRTEFERAGVEFSIEGRRIIDCKAIYHAMEPRNLSAAHQFYCGAPFDAAHSAEADTLATYRVLVNQLRRYPELPHTFEELHRLSNPRQADFVDSEGKLIWRNHEVHFNFGKHRGVPLREVIQIDLEYVRWLIAKDFRADLKNVLAAALEGRYPPRGVPPTTAAADGVPTL